METAIKIFLTLLIIGMGVIGAYCAYDINRIREKWRKDGKSEYEIRKDFYDSFNDD